MMVAQDETRDNGDSPPAILPVLHVADAGCFARFGRMFRQLGIALASEGVRGSILTDDAEAVPRFEGTPLAIHHFSALRGWGVWRLHGFLRRSLDPMPSVIHLWGKTALSQLSDFATSHGAQIVLHLTSDADMAAIEQRGLRSNEWLACMTTAQVERIQERFPQSANRVEVIAPALLRPEDIQDLQVRERTLGLLWAGRIENCEGLDVLVDAIAHMRAKNCDLQVAITGPAGNTAPVWQNIRARKVADCTSLIAEPCLWDQAMPGVDICVVSQREQELHLAPLLAMSLGKIVIASRDQEADWFQEDHTSLQFTPGSSVELAYHIMRTAEAYPNVLATARAAAAYVAEHHTIPNLATRLAGLYRRMTAPEQAQSANVVSRDG